MQSAAANDPALALRSLLVQLMEELHFAESLAKSQGVVLSALPRLAADVSARSDAACAEMGLLKMPDLVSVADIAARTGRTLNAIRLKIHRLRLQGRCPAPALRRSGKDGHLYEAAAVLPLFQNHSEN